MLLSEAIKNFCGYYNFRVQKNTNNSYSYILRNFCLFLRNPKIQDITIDSIIEWYRIMEELGWDNNSLLPKTIVLRRFFGYANDMKWTDFPVKLIPAPSHYKKLPRSANEETYRKLLSIIPQEGMYHMRNRALLMLYHDTGARNSEILSLDVEDVNLAGRSAIIRTEKAKNLPFREIFWTKETNEQLMKWIEARKKIVTGENEFLFIGLSKNKVGERLGNRGVVKMMAEYSRTAEMPTVNVHQWRHLFGRTLAKSGANNSSIASLMGHSDMQSSQVYTTLYGDDLREVWAKYRET